MTGFLSIEYDVDFSSPESNAKHGSPSYNGLRTASMATSTTAPLFTMSGVEGVDYFDASKPGFSNLDSYGIKFLAPEQSRNGFDCISIPAGVTPFAFTLRVIITANRGGFGGAPGVPGMSYSTVGDGSGLTPDPHYASAEGGYTEVQLNLQVNHPGDLVQASRTFSYIVGHSGGEMWFPNDFSVGTVTANDDVSVQLILDAHPITNLIPTMSTTAHQREIVAQYPSAFSLPENLRSTDIPPPNSPRTPSEDGYVELGIRRPTDDRHPTPAVFYNPLKLL